MRHKRFVTVVLLTGFLSTLSCVSFKFRRFMPRNDYYRHRRSTPYVLELNSDQGSLVYYGAFHKVNPAHPQFNEIEEKWNEFHPTHALCEGSLWPLEDSRDKAIRKHGEQGLLTYLAARDSVPVQCIDPPVIDQVFYLKNDFPPHLIKVYFVLRQAVVNRMLKKDRNDLRYVNKILKGLGKIDGFKHSPANLVEFEHRISLLFPELDDWQSIPRAYFYCPEKGKFLVEIHQMTNEYRDRSMVKKITSVLKNGNRVFAVVGRSHVVIQEPVLRSVV